ncbi:VOC family protein [Lewinella sp. IMCC34191]|uniref:VOC family protein n=1 Tax=Lewinella sp. IMCC34191 TaxID=2259172 RepID=UPI000E23E925|nr:VOC family protein [Lewinella sp. IMCC34191]
MPQSIAQFSLLVADYDEALSFYVDRLGFELLEDTRLGADKRWVRIRPAGAAGCAILLARPSTPEQRALIGRQAADRVWLFLDTDDFERDYRRLVEQGVEIVRERSEEAYGKVCVFADCYGNRWDLIQRTPDLGGGAQD